jgi:primosomal protein N' (replication factor Y)
MSDDTLPLWVEEGEAHTVPVATVVSMAPIDKLYAFAIPQDMRGRIAPGQRVRVPFGRRGNPAEAFVVDVSERRWDNTLRDVLDVIDEQAWLDATMIQLGQWLSKYYATPLGRTLAAMVPAGVKRQSGFVTRRWIRLARPSADILDQTTRVGPRQKQLLETLSVGSEVEVASYLETQQISSATLRGAIQRGWVIQRQESVPRNAPDFDEPRVDPHFSLNEEQRAACRAVAQAQADGRFKAILLHGVSGSGKTEVYIDAMRRVVAAGQQVIVLVPEIALTTQLVHRFASRFSNVAVLHSALTDMQRSLCWHAIREGEKFVVIGTRSSVFAPCRRLGLIVIDEEQDDSYKNQQSPRFHAREVAVHRARLLKIPVLLGSATPALETWHRSQIAADHQMIHLRRRVAGLQMPGVELVDMREEVGTRPGYHQLSRLLEERLGRTFAAGQQAVLFLNQRGYATALFCPKCRSRLLCPNCQASMVVHRSTSRVRCHHCHHHMAIPEQCSTAGCAGRLLLFGVGTERVEEELNRKFPAANVRRVDSDTMLRESDYEGLISDFGNGLIDILIGTQIVAKGLDFPGVSLVGVINADTALFRPDFRANERTFQLITQVAGRAGRAHGHGRVVVQTLMGDLPALQAAVNHDYATFAAGEMVTRRDTGMPPLSCLTRWLIQDPVESRLAREATVFADALRGVLADQRVTGADVIGPTPCAIERIRQMYRYDVLLRCVDPGQRSQLLHHVRYTARLHPRAERVRVDVDPLSLL